MTKYVEYRRVSTVGQGRSGLGLEAQQLTLDLFTRGGEVVGSYTEIASGSRMQGRPELEKAIVHAVREDAVLIVAKADRLSRNVVHALTVLDRIGEGSLMCCDCPDTNRLMLTMLFAFAEHERKLISMRTKASLAVVRANGSKSGNPIGRPPGMTVSPEMAKRAVDNRLAIYREKMAPVLKMIAEYVGMEKTYSEIAQILAIGGHTNSRGNPLTAKQVRRLALAHL